MSARGALADELHLDASAPTKTFVLEVHTDDPDAYLEELFGRGAVHSTDDGYLHRALIDEGEMWVDRLDSRFWSFHTDLPAYPARRFLHERVQRRRDLDWLWLPTQHLRRVSRNGPARRLRTDFAGQSLRGVDAPGTGLKLQATGKQAEKLLDFLSQSDEYKAALSLDAIQVSVDDGAGGVMNEAVHRQGQFAASGDSLDTHLQFVRSVVATYASFIELLEAKALGWDPLTAGDDNEGASLIGAPVGIHFSQHIADLSLFVEELFDSKEPFRLWGVPRVEDDVVEVDAVDLHVGQRLRMDVGHDWMRVYLERGSCGNTVARLVSNLQHRFDSGLELSDPALNAALMAGAAVAGSLVA
ncbi:MAG TPA: hypothetical protein VHB69_09215 [Mycobacteriales bacterium]|nr:hypothetical protein [Mycobacteriales bacterium]